MFSEFHDQEYSDAKDQGLSKGNSILELYEISDVNRTHDMMTLVGYAMIIHLLSFIVLQYKYVTSKKSNALMIGRKRS